MTDNGTGQQGQRNFSDHVFEIRYRPNAKILDRRGEWAERLSENLQLPRWQIASNRFDVWNEDTPEHRGFVSFSNSGYSLANAPTANYFPDHVVKFFKLVLALPDFPKPLYVIRIGVRQRFLTEFVGKFDELVKRYAERYLCPTDKAMTVIGGKLLDLGGPMNFADSLGNFNTNCGPVPEEQAKTFFPDQEPEDGFPKVALYYDIDYWLRPDKNVADNEILKAIRSFSTEAWERHARICDLIIGK